MIKYNKELYLIPVVYELKSVSEKLLPLVVLKHNIYFQTGLSFYKGMGKLISPLNYKQNENIYNDDFFFKRA